MNELRQEARQVDQVSRTENLLREILNHLGVCTLVVLFSDRALLPRWLVDVQEDSLVVGLDLANGKYETGELCRL